MGRACDAFGILVVCSPNMAAMAAMAAEGREFYLSRNGVWLTGPVEPRFLEAMPWAEDDAR